MDAEGAMHVEALMETSDLYRGTAEVAGDEQWTTVIRAKRGFLELRGRELWNARDLVAMLVWRDFVAVYKQTILGPVWHVFQPLLTTFTFTLVFGSVVRLSTDGLPPFLFYLSGMVIWTYFASCFTAISDTFAVNAPLFGKVYFPRLAVPVAIVLSKLVSLSIQFSVLMAAVAWYAFRGAIPGPSLRMLFVPFVLAAVMALALGAGMTVSALTARYRDLQLLVTFGVTLLMYATPIIYPMAIVPRGLLLRVLGVNPLAALIEAFRSLVLGLAPPPSEALFYAGAVSLGLLVLGLVVFNRVEARFIDTV